MSTGSEPRIVGLDTLRAAAIIMVIGLHARQILKGDFFGDAWRHVLDGGWIGVDLFFVLSGFLIGGQLIRAARRDGAVRFGQFYARRAFRILPCYYVVVALYALWPSFREAPEFGPLWRFMLFVMNYSRDGEAFSHAWSLCIEEHFYLAMPLLVAACVKWPRVFRPAILVASALVGVVILRLWLWSVDAPFFPSVYRPSHTHLDGLTVGVALALIRETRPGAWARVTARPWVLVLVGAVMVVGAAYGQWPAPLRYVLQFTVLSLGFGAWVAAAATPESWLARTKIPGAHVIATLAFTLYLTHKQMLHVAREIMPNYMGDPATTLALALALIVAAAVGLHVLVERPFLAWRHRLGIA